ncbi:MAG: hypothetical protein ABJC61_06140 [Acidobacteriota bacterium]
MKTQPVPTKILSVLALTGILSFCAAASLEASPPRSCGSCGVMFGLARGQVARINAVNIGDPNQRQIQVEMLFLDATGAVVARDVKTIAPGHAVFFDLPFNAGHEENRIELPAVLNGKQSPSPRRT